MAKHEVQRIGSAAATAPDRNAGRINVWMRPLQGLESQGLLFGGQHSNAAVHHLAPGASLWRWRPTIVEAHDQITFSRQSAMKNTVPPVPSINHGLRGRFAIHVNQNRVLPI